MNPAELPITGYLDRFSHRPGEEFLAHVGMRQAGPYRARLVRVISGDPNPAGPRLRLENLSTVFDRRLEGRHQDIHLGSFGIVERGPERDPRLPCTLDGARAIARRRAVERGRERHPGGGRRGECRGVIDRRARRRGAPGMVRPRSARGRVAALRRGADEGEAMVSRLARGRSRVGPRRSRPAGARSGSVRRRRDGAGARACAAVSRFGPRRRRAGNGAASSFHRKDRGSLHSRGLRRGLAGPARAHEGARRRAPRRWDFSLDIDTQAITDIGAQACHGRLVNLPTRAVVGAKWSGREMCWRHAPRDYAAIHFHDDDLDDCRWEPELRLDGAARDEERRLRVPSHLRGG